ncbi:MAG: hypothetical protein JW937_09785 [Candidatus Omnitrophica bacterium]|nr:hypothetical protein [Candidatus Omnitrophota bacterium]
MKGLTVTNKRKTCKHNFGGKKVEVQRVPLKLPGHCISCRDVFFSDKAAQFTLPSGEIVQVCQKCQEELTCGHCNKSLKLHLAWVGECFKCGEVQFFCRNCSKDLQSLPSYHQNQAIDKLKKVLQKVLGQLDQNQQLDSHVLPEGEKIKGGKTATENTVFFLNIFFGPYGWDDEEDDEWDSHNHD